MTAAAVPGVLVELVVALEIEIGKNVRSTDVGDEHRRR